MFDPNNILKLSSIIFTQYVWQDTNNNFKKYTQMLPTQFTW